MATVLTWLIICDSEGPSDLELDDDEPKSMANTLESQSSRYSVRRVAELASLQLDKAKLQPAAANEADESRLPHGLRQLVSDAPCVSIHSFGQCYALKMDHHR